MAAARRQFSETAEQKDLISLLGEASTLSGSVGFIDMNIIVFCSTIDAVYSFVLFFCWAATVYRAAIELTIRVDWSNCQWNH